MTIIFQGNYTILSINEILKISVLKANNFLRLMKNKFSLIAYLTENKEKKFLFLIVSINLFIKLFPAILLELGNDEVYYWTYALYPDWSHFDHPPMVGVTIQFFSLNLLFDNELFIRLGSLIFSSINLILLYYLVKKIYDDHSARIAVLLYTASFYFNIIAGLLILPDSPLMFFVMMALYFGVPSILVKNPTRHDFVKILLFGFFTGLAFLSKYHSLFLWFGFGLYVLVNNRIWLRKPVFYLSIFISVILMLPVLHWNIKNDFISFTFHGNRVGLFQNPLDYISFLQFNVGQIFYQNPVLFVIFVIAIFKFFSIKSCRSNQVNNLMIYLSLPLIILFTVFSLFRNTLPHWSGPAFLGLLIMSSEWLKHSLVRSQRNVVRLLLIANSLVFVVIILAFFQINSGFIKLTKEKQEPTELGEDDFTLDMYGWEQSKEKFIDFLSKEGIDLNDTRNVNIISNKWFPAAHLDYYIAHPLNIDLFALGKIGDTHKYFWMNKTKSLHPTDRFYFITSSQQYYSPDNYSNYFEKIIPVDTLTIGRNGKPVKNLFIYKMTELKVDAATLLNPDF